MCPLQLNLRCAQLVLDWAAPCWVVPVTTNCDFFFVLTSQICLSLGRTCSEMARVISNLRTNSPFASHVMPCVNAKLIFVEAFGSMRSVVARLYCRSKCLPWRGLHTVCLPFPVTDGTAVPFADWVCILRMTLLLLGMLPNHPGQNQ